MTTRAEIERLVAEMEASRLVREAAGREARAARAVVKAAEDQLQRRHGDARAAEIRLAEALRDYDGKAPGEATRAVVIDGFAYQAMTLGWDDFVARTELIP